MSARSPSGCLSPAGAADPRLPRSPEDLREAFARYGQINDVYIPKDHATGRVRGFGYVEFGDLRDAMEAKAEMDYKEICGSRIEVMYAQGERKSASQMARICRGDDPRGEEAAQQRSAGAAQGAHTERAA